MTIFMLFWLFGKISPWLLMSVVFVHFPSIPRVAEFTLKLVLEWGYFEIQSFYKIYLIKEGHYIMTKSTPGWAESVIDQYTLFLIIKICRPPRPFLGISWYFTIFQVQLFLRCFLTLLWDKLPWKLISETFLMHNAYKVKQVSCFSLMKKAAKDCFKCLTRKYWMKYLLGFQRIASLCFL